LDGLRLHIPDEPEVTGDGPHDLRSLGRARSRDGCSRWCGRIGSGVRPAPGSGSEGSRRGVAEEESSEGPA